jgi:tetratricopeptide (TPR) repeat protein
MRLRALGLSLAIVVGPSTIAAQAPLGEAEFPNSGAAAAQAPFLRGLLLLHSFEYEAAAAAFRDAQNLDPQFVLAYWGEAMTHTHPLWNQQDVPAAFGPPLAVKPSAELLGEHLLARGDRAGARGAFRAALALAPGRLLSERGLAAATGDGGNRSTSTR